MKAPEGLLPLKHIEDNTDGHAYLIDPKFIPIARFIHPEHAKFVAHLCNSDHDTRNGIKELHNRISRAVMELEDIEHEHTSLSVTSSDRKLTARLRDIIKDLRGEIQG